MQTIYILKLVTIYTCVICLISIYSSNLKYDRVVRYKLWAIKDNKTIQQAQHYI